MTQEPILEYDWTPTEGIKITGERSDLYDKMPGRDREVLLPDLGPFLMKTFHEAHEGGHLARTVDHYVKELETLGALDQGMFSTLKALSAEAKTNQYDRSALDITHAKIRDVVKTFRVERRKS